MRRSRLSTLRERLGDERNGRVLYVSHCLLNENVRYVGGAARRGAVDEVVDECRLRGIGICQMPCPEQRAWGGALKRFIAPLYGRHPLQGVAPALYGPFQLYTQAVYARVARRLSIWRSLRERRNRTLQWILARLRRCWSSCSPSPGFATPSGSGRWACRSGSPRWPQASSAWPGSRSTRPGHAGDVIA